MKSEEATGLGAGDGSLKATQERSTSCVNSGHWDAPRVFQCFAWNAWAFPFENNHPGPLTSPSLAPKQDTKLGVEVKGEVPAGPRSSPDAMAIGPVMRRPVVTGPGALGPDLRDVCHTVNEPLKHAKSRTQ